MNDTALSRPDNGIVEKAITFLYYVDLPKAFAFYTEVMGFPLEIDQGWSKIPTHRRSCVYRSGR